MMLRLAGILTVCAAVAWVGVVGAAEPSGPVASPSAADNLLVPFEAEPPELRLPAEFEPQKAIVFAPDLRLDGVDGATFAAIFKALENKVRLVAVLPEDYDLEQFHSAMTSHGVGRDAIRLIRLPYNSSWIRDYGPIFVENRKRLLAADTEYRFTTRFDDDRIPAGVASHFHTNATASPLLIEGGNLLSNGKGLCVTTTAVIRDNSSGFDAKRGHGHDYNEALVTELMRRHFGCEEVIYLEPLAGEGTSHVDMFTVFTSADTVVVGQYHPAVDPVNAELLDRNAERLSSVVVDGRPLRVVRIPMPTNRDGVWRTYTNVLFANGTLLVPSYPGVDPEAERAAVEIYRRLLPDWNVVAIDISTLIRKGGGLHCLAVNVPKSDPMAAE